MDSFMGHGGRLDAAMRAWPDAPRPWVDLSTGVNPAPYPCPRASRAVRARLPFAEEIAALEALAGVAFGINDPDQVLATAGAEAGLRLLPQLLNAQAAMVAGPTYASHAEAWSQAGARLVEREDEAAVVVIVNPNNPDGRVVDQARLLQQADRLAARDGWLVVDESFADVSPGASIAAHGHPHIVALRSFGKFYGLAGLRLGFLLGAPQIVHRARLRQGAWPVSADALAAGRAAYADPDWRERTQARLARAAARLDATLIRCGFRIVGGTPLFRLARADDAQDRFAALCARGILTRPFAGEPTWLRFGLPQASGRRRVKDAIEALA
jgi:cobalamin biosynthesis protein CobC